MPHIRPAHSQYHRQQHQRERTQAYRQARADAAYQKRANSVFAKRAMREVERDYHHNREWYVFAVDERVRVQARMQQEHQHSEQRYPAAAGYAIGEHAARKAARDKEQMGKQVARQVDMAAVLQSKRALRQQQWHFKGYAVVAIISVMQRVGCAGGDIVGVGAGDLALGFLIAGHAIVVHHGDARDREQRAQGKRLQPERDAAQHGKAG